MSEDLEHDMTATSWNILASSFKGNFISIFCTLGFDQSVAKRGEKWHRQCLPRLCQPQLPLCWGEKDFLAVFSWWKCCHSGGEHADGNERCGIVLGFCLVRLASVTLYISLYLYIFISSTSASLEPSYVLRALGAEEDMAHSSIRWLSLFLIGLKICQHAFYMDRKLTDWICQVWDWQVHIGRWGKNCTVTCSCLNTFISLC